jgi:hypothetical protein
MDDDKFKVEEMPKESRSSPGRQDSTIMAFSRQLTKSSAMSDDPVDLVKVPAKRQSPPNPMPETCVGGNALLWQFSIGAKIPVKQTKQKHVSNPNAVKIIQQTPSSKIILISGK